MTDRAVAEIVGTNVADVITAARVSFESVAEATDLSRPELNERLHGDRPFSVRELVRIGGFLHFPPSHFLQGVPA